MPDAEAPITPTTPSPRRWIAAVTLVAIAALALVVVAWARRPDPPLRAVDASNAAGDSACLSCHRDKASYETTAHRLTMRAPSREAIRGSFEPGRNELRTTVPGVHFRMHADSAGFYQTLVAAAGADTTVRTERIAYVGGSGRKGQSYLYWRGNQLYQLPVSYWTILDGWFGSPGRSHIDPRASFDRGVAPRCFECHATWIQTIPDPGQANRYDSAGAILGITCERCHASGREHARRERSVLRPVLTRARGTAIVNPARLERERKIEACAQCHAGGGQPKLPSFTYVAGRPLLDYLTVTLRSSEGEVDVHGNQVALLARSRCFEKSQMTCQTCHDVHRPQRDVAELSGKCLQCHEAARHPALPDERAPLPGRCADCHMPLQPSSVVVFQQGGREARVQVRSHWIRVY